MSKPLLVEILAYAPTAFYHCTHCEVAWRSMGMSNQIHEEQVNSSLPPDIAQDYQAISDWVRELFKTHCDHVLVKVIDAASIEGFVKTFQHRVHRYPTIVINGKKQFGLQQLSEAEKEIAQILEVGA